MSDRGTVPLSPVSFLERAGDVYSEKVSIVTPSGVEFSYAELRDEARRIADGLRERGLVSGVRVAVLSRNGPHALAMHFGVPGAGAVLVALNTRLAPREYAFILQDSGAQLLFLDPALRHRIAPILDDLVCEVVDLPDPDTGAEDGEGLGTALVQWRDGTALADTPLQGPDDEHAAITINYTSGTTGSPKGAVYTHRGAYLNALGVALELQVGPGSAYLWTLPMFHCNGWCFTWAVTAVGATHVTMADFHPAVALTLMDRHRVTQLCGAPVVLQALADEGARSEWRFDHHVRFATGGAPPSPTVIAGMSALGVDVVHLYGLTETYGPSLVCEPQPSWEDLDTDELAAVMSRQGVRTVNVEAVRVVDDTFNDVPADGESMGEIVVRSNTVVPRYHQDDERSDDAFRDGWFLTGDLAVVHPDGYLEVRDRRKDIIISGGENVSSIEVENQLVAHLAVAEAAVVGAPHTKWGEVPVAFVTLRSEGEATEQELIDHVRERLAHFKAPHHIIFDELPKTSTGKIQKYELRDRISDIDLVD